MKKKVSAVRQKLDRKDFKKIILFYKIIGWEKNEIIASLLCLSIARKKDEEIVVV
jgi:hypothetical protein